MAIGSSNWLFAGSLHAGKLRCDGHEPAAPGAAELARPYAYLRDVLKRPPTQAASRIADLLPHRWLATRAS